MKESIKVSWIYLRYLTSGRGGEIGFWAIIGGVVLAAAYFAYPAPFQNFFATIIDMILDTVSDAFRGGTDGNPDKKLQVK